MNRLPAAGIVARVAGLATAAVLLWAFAPASGKMAETQTVAITIRYSRFIPARITVRPGTTVRFVITNTDPIDHEFILGTEAVQQRHETGIDPKHGAVPGEVSVAPGDTAETTYTFSRPGLLLI
ncbi:MAG TPA: cupredoxin domain-containing protein, partial [bacterium]